MDEYENNSAASKHVTIEADSKIVGSELDKTDDLFFFKVDVGLTVLSTQRSVPFKTAQDVVD